MKKKFIILALLLSSCIVFLHFLANAVNISSTVNKPQIRVLIGHVRHDRGLHRGWYKGRHIGWYNYNPRHSRWVSHVYYINGRPYVRWVRYNY